MAFARSMTFKETDEKSKVGKHAEILAVGGFRELFFSNQ